MKTMAKEEEKTGKFSVIVLENTTGHDVWRLQQCCWWNTLQEETS